MAGLLSAPLQHQQTLHCRSRDVAPSPNIRPQPSNQKPIDVTANTMKFLERMLTQFFARQKPRLDAAEAQVHEEHEHAGDQHPHRIDGYGEVGGRVGCGFAGILARRLLRGRRRSFGRGFRRRRFLSAYEMGPN